MNKPILSLALLALAGCSANEPLTASLELSDGHGNCLAQHLAGELDAARIAEVIPSQMSCSINDAPGLFTTGFRACPKQVTTVHFGRKSRPELTDAIPQAGWIYPDTPIRIARKVDGGYVVFTLKSKRKGFMQPEECSAFEQLVRIGLKNHFIYAKKQGPSKQ